MKNIAVISFISFIYSKKFDNKRVYFKLQKTETRKKHIKMKEIDQVIYLVTNHQIKLVTFILKAKKCKINKGLSNFGHNSTS